MIRIAVEDQQIVVKIFGLVIKEAEKFKMHYIQLQTINWSKLKRNLKENILISSMKSHIVFNYLGSRNEYWIWRTNAKTLPINILSSKQVLLYICWCITGNCRIHLLAYNKYYSRRIVVSRRNDVCSLVKRKHVILQYENIEQRRKYNN